jgi:hypothetical protein
MMNEDLPLFADSERQIEEAKQILKTQQSEEHVRLLASVYPFSLICSSCDMDGPATYDQAKAEGWREIDFDETGLSWNFLGDCPDCVREEAARLAP